MLRRFIPAAVVLVVACSAPPRSPDAPAPITRTDRIGLSAETMDIAGEINVPDEVYTQPVAAASSRAFAALPGVFRELGLSVTTIDPATGLVKGEILRTRKPFGGKMLTQLLDCGTTSAGPTAARYNINMTITSRVSAVSETSADVATVVQAVALPSTTMGNSVRCRPAPAFAELIARRVTEATRGS